MCVCVHACSAREDSSGLYEKIKTITFGGAVEGMDFAKVREKQSLLGSSLKCDSASSPGAQDCDIIVVGVREDNLLHCYDLSTDSIEEVAI